MYLLKLCLSSRDLEKNGTKFLLLTEGVLMNERNNKRGEKRGRGRKKGGI